jgi:hypothetical protein
MSPSGASGPARTRHGASPHFPHAGPSMPLLSAELRQWSAPQDGTIISSTAGVRHHPFVRARLPTRWTFSLRAASCTCVALRRCPPWGRSPSRMPPHPRTHSRPSPHPGTTSTLLALGHHPAVPRRSMFTLILGRERRSTTSSSSLDTFLLSMSSRLRPTSSRLSMTTWSPRPERRPSPPLTQHDPGDRCTHMPYAILSSSPHPFVYHYPLLPLLACSFTICFHAIICCLMCLFSRFRDFDFVCFIIVSLSRIFELPVLVRYTCIGSIPALCHVL